ncbi:MAG: hypothetical protein AAGK25_12615 [Pseudomonadota bacterium]
MRLTAVPKPRLPEFAQAVPVCTYGAKAVGAAFRDTLSRASPASPVAF